MQLKPLRHIRNELTDITKNVKLPLIDTDTVHNLSHPDDRQIGATEIWFKTFYTSSSSKQNGYSENIWFYLPCHDKIPEVKIKISNLAHSYVPTFLYTNITYT